MIPPPVLLAFRAHYYGGRAYANDLAGAGFVVLVHDTFLWGSRRFPMETMPEPIRRARRGLPDALGARTARSPRRSPQYNAAAGHHEHWMEKYCTLLGTTLAGVVSYEDRVAVNYLQSRPDVLPERIGCIGLSGGGNRAALLQATCDGIAAAVIVGLMSTYEQLLDHNMSHTWMFFPHGWARYGDWPDLAASRAPAPLLVQYDRGRPPIYLGGDARGARANRRALSRRRRARRLYRRFLSRPAQVRSGDAGGSVRVAHPLAHAGRRALRRGRGPSPSISAGQWAA